MRYRTFSIASLIILACFTDKNIIRNIKGKNVNNDLILTKIVSISSDTVPSFFDTTIRPFKDHSYKLALHVFNTNTESLSPDKNNAVLTFVHSYGNKKEFVFKDSLYCMFGEVEQKDFNNDMVKDLIFIHYTGARANPTYYLFLVDKVHKKLSRVKGFEELPNPELDSVNNIITSAALYGSKVGWSFYRINTKGKLINLGHSFEGEFGGDDEKYNKAIRAIKKENKK